MKNVFKSKTIWVALLTALLPLIMQWVSPEQLAEWGVNPYITSLIGVLFGYLRTITKEAVTL